MYFIINLLGIWQYSMLVVDVAEVLVVVLSSALDCARSSIWPLDGGVCKATTLKLLKMFIKMINNSDGSMINCLSVSVKRTFVSSCQVMHCIACNWSRPLKHI